MNCQHTHLLSASYSDTMLIFMNDFLKMEGSMECYVFLKIYEKKK